MKKLTKLLAFLLLITMACAFFACKGNETVKAYFYSNNELIAEFDVKSGEAPDVSSIKTPVKAETETSTYTFVGWMPEIGKITEDTVYAAIFKEEKKPDTEKETVTASFYNGDELVTTIKVKSGETPDVSNITTPVKADTESHTYEFTGWSPEVGAITQDTKYIATFKETVKQFNVVFYSSDSVYSEAKVEYDQTATAPAEEPKYTDTTKKFAGWSLDKKTAIDLSTYKITENTDFYALFVLADYSEMLKSNFNLVKIDTDMSILYGAIEAGAGQYSHTTINDEEVLYLQRLTWGKYQLKFANDFIKAAQNAGKIYVKVTYAHIRHANGSKSEFKPFYTADGTNNQACTATGFDATAGTETAEYTTGWFTLDKELVDENCAYGFGSLSLEHRFYIKEISFHSSLPNKYTELFESDFNLVGVDSDMSILYGAIEAGAGQYSHTTINNEDVLYLQRLTWGNYQLKFANDFIKAAQDAGKIYVKVTYAHIRHANGSLSEFKPFYTADGTKTQACTATGFDATAGTQTAEYVTGWFTLDKEIVDENSAYGFGSLSLEHIFYIKEISFHSSMS